MRIELRVVLDRFHFYLSFLKDHLNHNPVGSVSESRHISDYQTQIAT